nr:piggyBac transposable element-derived protein 4-like [Cherax quadricarinatus]
MTVIDYTQNMRLVDKCDMQIGFVDCVRKSYKWYMKLFFHLVEISVLNAYNMYQIKTGNRPLYDEFCFSVVRQRIMKYQVTIPAIQNCPRTPQDILKRLRREGDHFIIQLPATKKKFAQKRCVVCAQTKRRQQRRKETRPPVVCWML